MVSRCHPDTSRLRDPETHYNPGRLEEPEEIPESELIRVRREKLARIAALGFDPYPTRAETDRSIPEVVASYLGTDDRAIQRSNA